MKHIKKLKIDIDKKNFEVIPSVQYDSNTRFLHINLLNGSVPFNLTGCSVKISGTKPDGTAILNNCTVINAKEGFIEVELTEQMNAVPGTLKCELKLYAGNGVLTTKQFDIEVTASVTSKEITSSNEFKALEEALSKVNNIDNKFESLTSEVVAKEAEKEIQKQIASGNLTHMTIAPGSITQDKLSPNIKFGIDDGEVTNEKIANHAVSIDKLDFIEESLPYNKNILKNLYNPDKNKYVSATNGSLVSSQDVYATGYIKIGGVVPCIRSQETLNWIDTAFYDENKRFISGVTGNNAINFTTPVNCAYIRTTIPASYLGVTTIMCNGTDVIMHGISINEDDVIGDDILRKKTLKVNINQLDESITSGLANQFNKEKGELGWLNLITGVVSYSNKDWTSDFISCLPNEVWYKCENSSNAINTQGICFYNKNKQFIKGIKFLKNDNWRTFVTPENAYFFRFDMLLTHIDTEEIYGHDVILSANIKIQQDSITSVGIQHLDKSILADYKPNLYDKNKGEAGWIHMGNGVVNENTKDWTSDFIPCLPNKKYYKGTNGSSTINRQGIGFFNKNKEFISGMQTPITKEPITFTTPENAYFFRFDMLVTHRDVEEIYAEENPQVISDDIKIRKSNILGMEEDEPKNQLSIVGEDGIKYVLKVDASGRLDITPAKTVKAPSDMNAFTTTGKSCIKGDILVTPHTDSNSIGWLIVLDSDLRLKKYKKLTSFAYNFRRYKNSSGELRYIYCQTVNGEHPKMPNNGGYDNTKLVIADKDFTVLHEYYLKKYGTVPEGHPVENHEVIYFDDNHFMVSAYVRGVVSNIPGKNGEYKVLNCIIQEVKDGKVVFHWESIDHVELYEYACMNKNFAGYPNTQATYNDYHHLNSIQIDPLNPNHLLVSSRFIGLMKIDKTTGNIIWMFGRGGRIDFDNMTKQQAPYLQHHMTRLYDGSIICFDNEGCATNNTRICRYWLDEKNMTMTNFKEYITKHPRSAHMGSVDMIQEGVFLINYGGRYSGVTFEEYDFNKDKQNFSFKFNDGTDCYRVWKDVD